MTDPALQELLQRRILLERNRMRAVHHNKLLNVLGVRQCKIPRNNTAPVLINQSLHHGASFHVCSDQSCDTSTHFSKPSTCKQ